MALAREVYRITQGFPDTERYGPVAQLRRAAVSVPSNIAEGQGRLTKGEFKQFLGQARGSLFELETQLQLASQLGFARSSEVSIALKLSGEVHGMASRLILSLGQGGNLKLETRNLKPIA